MSGPVDPQADLPPGVSHLLAANDALIPGCWGAHSTLCGLQVRRPAATAVDHECADVNCCCVRYCIECVAEAARWGVDSDRAAGVCRGVGRVSEPHCIHLLRPSVSC